MILKGEANLRNQIVLVLLTTILTSQISLAQETPDAATLEAVTRTQSDPNSVGPIGTVVASMLSEAQFQRIAGSGWILADGRSVAGSLYARYTNRQAAPDLRGMFLRGQNNNRTDGNQNPELKQVGELQSDEFKSHSHSVPHPSGRDGNRSGHQDAWFGNGGTSTGAAGGPETRPRNITVNYLIRIN